VSVHRLRIFLVWRAKRHPLAGRLHLTSSTFQQISTGFKKIPLLWPPLDRASKTGDFCDAKITTPQGNLQLKSAKNRLFY